MKKAAMQWAGWAWIAVVLYLYAAQVPRLRPAGMLGSLVDSFYAAMTAPYLN